MGNLAAYADTVVTGPHSDGTNLPYLASSNHDPLAFTSCTLNVRPVSNRKGQFVQALKKTCCRNKLGTSI